MSTVPNEVTPEPHGALGWPEPLEREGKVWLLSVSAFVEMAAAWSIFSAEAHGARDLSPLVCPCLLWLGCSFPQSFSGSS